MNPDVLFNTLWPIISAGVIMPLLQWLKKKLPGDWPIRSSIMSVFANALVIIALNITLKLGMNFEAMMPFIIYGYTVSAGMHALKKSYTKNVIGG